MAEVLQIAVCDDTQADVDNILDMINQCVIETNCVVFHSGEELLEAFRPHVFDLLLSDIYMGGMSGVETVKRIREIDENIPVAFITTSPDFALQGYRLNALKYIEKPFKRQSIVDILELAQMKKETAPALVLWKSGKEERLRLDRIEFLEQQARKLYIHMRDGSLVQVYDKLSDVTEQLDDALFFCPHKSYAVNLSYVRGIDTELRCFLMAGGDTVPIRRESMRKAKQALQQHLFTQTREGSV